MTAIWDFVSNAFQTITTLLTSLGPIFVLVSGIFTLFFGRKLFWVFVGIVGFMVGFTLAEGPISYLPESWQQYHDFLMLAIALFAAILCIAVQKIGAVVAGAAAFGLLGFWLAGRYDLSPLVQWSAAAGSAILGGILLIFIFDWTLIIISAFFGAGVSVLGFEALGALPAGTGPWLFLILFAMGVVYQRMDEPAGGARRMGGTRAESKTGSALSDGELQPLEMNAAQSLGRPAVAAPTIGIPSYAGSVYAPKSYGSAAQTGKQEPKRNKPAYEVYG